MQLNAANKLKFLTPIAITVLVVAYPFIGYQFLQQGLGSWLSITLALLLLWRAYRANTLQQRNIQLGLATLLILATVLIGAITSKFIPVVIFLSLATLFGGTLSKPPSLIERMVRLQFANIPDEVLNYCRQLTIIWTLLFILIAITSISLSYYASNWWWAMFHGVIAYALMTVLAVAEFIYRTYRFPFMKDEIPPLRETFMAILKNQEQLWK